MEKGWIWAQGSGSFDRIWKLGKFSLFWERKFASASPPRPRHSSPPHPPPCPPPHGKIKKWRSKIFIWTSPGTNLFPHLEWASLLYFKLCSVKGSQLLSGNLWKVTVSCRREGEGDPGLLAHVRGAGLEVKGHADLHGPWISPFDLLLTPAPWEPGRGGYDTEEGDYQTQPITFQTLY